MRIYTSYFAGLKKLRSDIIPISICGKPIKGWTGLEYKSLAPSWSIYNEYKNLGGTKENYTVRYNNEILKNLDRNKVIEDFLKLGKGNDIVLVCYEKPNEFCHRHLVANWLNYNVKEYEKESC